MVMNQQENKPRPFRALVPACAERDIGRTRAFELMKAGLVETFKIGTKNYVFIDSLDTLPSRLKEWHPGRRAAA